MIRTVTGDIEKVDGTILIHEHIQLVSNDLVHIFGSDWVNEKAVEDYCVEVFRGFRENFGLGLFVDATPWDAGRNAQLYINISKRTGIPIVATSGLYCFPSLLSVSMTPEHIANLVIKDCTEGMEGTGALPGILKCAASGTTLTEDEKLRIAGLSIAQKETGLPLYIHTFHIWEIHTALHSGKIHATSAGSLSVAACPEAKWRALIRFDDKTSYFAVTKNEKGEKLIARINEAHDRILSIDENFGLKLQQKYANKFNKDAPTLSEAEKSWLEKRGVLKVGYCEDRRPLAYTDENGKLMGLLKEYLDAISKQYGLNFEVISYATGDALLAALQNKEVDIIAPVGYNSGMAEIYDLAITNPLTIETMVAVYKGYKGTEPKDIFGKIAILDNSITEKDYAKRFYPDSEWVKANTIEKAIDLVAEDKAGCYIIRSSTWSWYKNEYPRLNDLQVLTLSNSNAVNMAIRNEDISLLPILNDGISLLTEADINQYIVAYSDSRAEMTLFTLMKDHPITTAIGILAFILFIGLVFVLYRFQSEKKYLAKLEKANEEAEIAKDEAEKASMAKSTFLTSMSHDIRTPMNAIVGMTTLARKHINDTDYVKNCLSKVTLASDHLLTLVNDVLDINKIETGKLSLNPTVFSLADAIMNLANIGRHQLSEKNHRFEIRVHNITQEYLFADELRINQILINLLSNAVKYTPAGGEIAVDVKEETIPNEKDKIRLIFEIKDTGIGMSKEFQAKMYELFCDGEPKQR